MSAAGPSMAASAATALYLLLSLGPGCSPVGGTEQVSDGRVSAVPSVSAGASKDGHDEPRAACSGSDEAAAFGFYPDRVGVQGIPCAASCSAGGNTCVSDCVRGEVGERCSVCLESLVECTLACPSCGISESDPFGCTDCVVRSCLPDYAVCSGLFDRPRPGDPLPGLSLCTSSADAQRLRSPLGSDWTACADLCGDAACRRACLAETLETSARCAGCVSSLTGCAEDRCGRDCGTLPSTCGACVARECEAEFVRCAGTPVEPLFAPAPLPARALVVTTGFSTDPVSLMRSDSGVPVVPRVRADSIATETLPAGTYGIAVSARGWAPTPEYIAEGPLTSWAPDGSHVILLHERAGAPIAVTAGYEPVPGPDQVWVPYNGLAEAASIRLAGELVWSELAPGSFGAPVELTPAPYPVELRAGGRTLALEAPPLDGSVMVRLWIYDRAEGPEVIATSAGGQLVILAPPTTP